HAPEADRRVRRHRRAAPLRARALRLLRAPHRRGRQAPLQPAPHRLRKDRTAMEGFIWDPGDHPWTRESNVAAFMRQHGFETHHQLRARSVEDIDWFWDAAMKDIGVEWQ